MFSETVDATPNDNEKKDVSKKAVSQPVFVQQLDTNQNVGEHGDMEEIKAKPFTFAEMEYATENFNPDYFLGEGGFGKVFKGKLKDSGQVLKLG